MSFALSLSFLLIFHSHFLSWTFSFGAEEEKRVKDNKLWAEGGNELRDIVRFFFLCAKWRRGGAKTIDHV